METKVFCIYILLGILFGIIDLIYHYNECKEITLRDILLCPFFIIIWPIPTFLLLIESAGNIKILKKEHTSCTNKDKVDFVKMSIFIYKEVSNETKIQIMKILREQFDVINLSLRIGEYNILPKVITKEEANIVVKKLEPYNVICTYKKVI